MEGELGVQVKEKFVRAEASSPILVPEVRLLHEQPRIPQDVG